MNKFSIFLVLSHLFFFSCESIPPPPDFEAEPVSVSSEEMIEVEAHTAAFFIFSPPKEAIYTLSVYNMSTDFDLTLGIYCDTELFSDQIVIAVSKNLYLEDETIEISLSPDEKYLIEIWNTYEDTGSCRFNITEKVAP